MSSANEGSTGFVWGGRVNKTDKTRRSWSLREKEVLLAALKKLVSHGWKSDNGFRAGYLNKLEDAMKKEYLSTDLKGMPHINSKVTIWKKNYNSMCSMLKVSGVGFFGFNKKGTHMIDCTDEQWSEIIRLDRNARLMRYKGWPYLDDWSVIFGKDRATGDEAEDLMEAAHKMYRNLDLNQSKVDDAYHVSLEDIFENVDVDDIVSQTHKSVEEERPAGKKRKQPAGPDRMYEALIEITRTTCTTGERLDTIAGRMGYDFDISKARKEVFSQLGSIQGLTLKEKFEVTDLLAKEVERLDVFSSLPEDARAEYVTHILEMKNKQA